MALGLQRILLSRSLPATAAALLALTPARGDEPGGPRFQQAAEIFQARCTACHSYGKGTKVGPDLKGVTGRRQRGWLVKFVRASSELIAARDPIATALFTEFKEQRMPDWSDLSERQVEDLLDYLAIGGPEIRAPDERAAQSATPEEIERGRLLFDGALPFRNGARACSSCHAARGSGWIGGGSLGPDLSVTYQKYQDRALTWFLRKPCFRWELAGGGPSYLTPEESFTVKAFLRRSTQRTKSGGGS